VQADFEVDAALVARLVDAQHPDLAGPVTFIGNGWDNALFRLGDRHLARLPRRQIAADLVANEQRWLPELAGRLGIDIPVPIRVGRAGSGYPWQWSIVPWFEGVVASDVAPDGRGSLALDLADFVARLHTTAPPDAPVNPFRGGPLASRAAVVQRRLQTLAIPRAPEVGALWSQLVSVPAWDGPALWLHGDLHPANILLDGAGHLRAVLDFGDLTGGDPATDLAVAWLAFGAADRAAFLAWIDDLTGTDSATWQRARGWAIVFATAFLEGSEDGSPLLAIARHTLEQVLGDPWDAPGARPRRRWDLRP
jgi:aminoglycoside phosphotransferase (APT) family kinase protein